MTDTEFRRRYDELTATLSTQNETLLTVSLPMLCNADTDAVEEFIVNHWRQPVVDDNFELVGLAFKVWFGERYPEEYVKSNFALNAPPKKRDAAKERQWDHTRAARSAARNERQNAAARAAGFTSARNLLTELEKGNVTVVRKS